MEWGRPTAADVVAGGGTAVIVGRDQDPVDEAVMGLSAKGVAWRITAGLARFSGASRMSTTASWPTGNQESTEAEQRCW